MNFINYLKDLRIQHAKELLVTTDLHIAEISLQAGFENEKHFMKVFRGMVGVSLPNTAGTPAKRAEP